ncbi:MAG: pectin acetylesterase-family hydrolase [Enhygromyxa sp.]
MVLAGCASDPDALGGGEERGTGDSEDSSGPTTDADAEGNEASHETSDGPNDDDDDDDDDTTGPAEPYCGDGKLDPGEECDDGNDDPFDGCRDDCTLVELLEPPAMEWTYFEVPGTRCMDGSTAGFGVSYNPDSPDVMIYLEGGGACFNDTCDFTAFNLPFVPPSDGIFSRSSGANPVADWTMIYVPYCTGDIHAGDGEKQLGGQLRQFRGYSNITKYLEQWVPSFPAERVLLTGISAGGFGAALNTTQVARAYGDEVLLTVIDDSGPPLSDAVIPPCLQTLFRETWNLEATVLAECPNCDPNDFASGLMDHVFENYPDVQFGLFSNSADQIIRTYMGFGWGNGQHDNCEGVPLAVPALTYSADLIAIRALHEAHASTFYVLGVGHTALRVGFNLTYADGVSLPEWIADVIDGQISHLGL